MGPAARRFPRHSADNVPLSHHFELDRTERQHFNADSALLVGLSLILRETVTVNDGHSSNMDTDKNYIYLRDSELDFRVDIDLIVVGSDDFGEVEKDASVSFSAADEAVAFLDSGHDARLAFFARHVKGFV